MNYLTGLDCAVWEITLACNMNCKHCGSSAGVKREHELNTYECYKLIEDLAECNCETVPLMGGEPFIRDDWNLLAQAVKDVGMELAFVTNGLLMEKIVTRLARLEPCVVGLSLDGVEETNDNIRRKGSFEAVITAISLLKEHNVPVTIITTVSKTNFTDLPKIRDVIKPIGVNWQIQVAMPFGNFDPKILISEEEFYASAMLIASEGIENHYKNPTIGAHCYGYFSHFLPGGSKGWNGCTAEKSTIGINPMGVFVAVYLWVTINTWSLMYGIEVLKIFGTIQLLSSITDFKSDQLGPYCLDCYYEKILFSLQPSTQFQYFDIDQLSYYAQQLLNQGIKTFNEHQLEEAKALLQESLRFDPTLSLAHWNLARVLQSGSKINRKKICQNYHWTKTLLLKKESKRKLAQEIDFLKKTRKLDLEAYLQPIQIRF